jgi:dienelactone hydrolase
MSSGDLKQFEFPEPKSSDVDKYQSRTVFWLGEGPGVLLMHELPGLTEYVVDFGRQLAENGYTVFMPVMFGKPFPNKIERLTNELSICLNREFSLFAQNKSSPITDWLRALCRKIHERCGGPGIGALGLCLSGGFVLSLMVDPSVIAPVASEPSLPLCPFRDLQKEAQAALGISPDELHQATNRSHAEGIPLVGLRFKNDWICPGRRFETLKREFGDNFRPIELPSEPGNSYAIPARAHSVLTEDYGSLKKYIDTFPNKDPRKQVIDFLNHQLKGVSVS